MPPVYGPAPDVMIADAPIAFLLFAAAWGANHFVPLLLVYRTQLGLTPTELAQVFGIYAAGLVPGLLLGGPLSDRIGRRRVVIRAALVALAGTTVLGAGPRTFAALLLGRFVVGLGSGATFSAGTAWVQDRVQRRARDGVPSRELGSPPATTASGARTAAVALSAGFGGGPLLAGLSAQWLPWPLVLPYFLQAVVMMAALLLVFREPAHRPSSMHAPSSAAPFLPVGFGRQVVPMAPWVFGFPAIAFAVLPGLVRAQVAPFAVAYAGLVTGVTLLAGVLVQSPLRTRSSRAAARFGLSVGACGLAIAAAAARAVSPVAVLVAAAVLGAGYGGCMVSGLRFAEVHSAPDHRGRVTGVFYALAYVGFAAPLLLAATAGRVGDAAGLLGACALATASLALTVVLGRDR